MMNEELQKRLELHELWISDSYDGVYADFRSSNLQYADLQGADLRYSDFRNADLRYANLRDTNLRYADLRNARLDHVKTSPRTLGFHMRCPEVGKFMAFKKCVDGDIVTLKIPEDAKRSSATSNKCRCDRAFVVAIEDINGNYKDATWSSFDNSFIYKVGEMVSVSDFDSDRWNECTAGIHFFLTRDEAVLY